mmetsp:Transcript_20918/g.51888  ORF Transcript_20918/g.51888 Transcript_20918/m.51888 type:complete len:176 (-) Transcript_20918:256-783(-)
MSSSSTNAVIFATSITAPFSGNGDRGSGVSSSLMASILTVSISLDLSFPGVHIFSSAGCDERDNVDAAVDSVGLSYSTECAFDLVPLLLLSTDTFERRPLRWQVVSGDEGFVGGSNLRDNFSLFFTRSAKVDMDDDICVQGVLDVLRTYPYAKAFCLGIQCSGNGTEYDGIDVVR